MKSLLFALILLLLAGSNTVFAQGLKAGPQVLTIHSTVDDTEQPYAIYLPAKFNPKKAYPLVVSLHGAGSNHRLNLKRVFGKSNQPGETDVEASRYFPKWKDVDYIVVSPFARGTMGYQGVAEKDVMDVIADVKSRFRIDEDRMYLTGLSMGGGGTLWIGLTRPDLWAAIAPVCPAPPAGTDRFAANALNFPVHIHQGDADPAVRPEGTRAWVERLKGLGTQVGYTEYPGVQHNSWENAYANGQIFDWFGKYRRNAYPERVRFATDRYKYDHAYWVQVDVLTPGTPAQIDARFTASNRIEVTTSALDGFTLKLAGHPRFKRKGQVQVIVDGKQIDVVAADSLSFNRQGGTWAIGRFQAPVTAKRKGFEGPINEVVADRHVYVYGTAGNPSPEELQARRAIAQKAADWAFYRGEFMGRVMVFPRVLSDKEVRPSDLEAANLVLFGTKETNELIARFADRLPMQLTGSLAEYGLVYVFPLNGRNVLVNSGLPWWQASATAPSRPDVVALRLPNAQDFVLFRNEASSVVAGGRFGSDWRLSAEDAGRLKASGVVTISNEGMATR